MEDTRTCRFFLLFQQCLLYMYCDQYRNTIFIPYLYYLTS